MLLLSESSASSKLLANDGEIRMAQDPSIWFDATLAISGILLGAALTWVSTFYFQWRRERSEHRRLLTVLFGELLNIRQHYFFASSELPSGLSSKADVLALKMSRYGALAFSGSDLSHLGFLRDDDIRDLMQLALVVRNTDYSIDLALDGHGEDDADLSGVQRRMTHAMAVTEHLIEAIAYRNPRLQSIVPEELKRA